MIHYRKKIKKRETTVKFLLILEVVEIKMKVDKTIFDIKIYELSSKEKKMEFIIQESISIVLVFNLDERSSFENLGNNIIQLKKVYKFENNFYILGSSPNNDKCTYEDEVSCLIQKCELTKNYNEITKYDVASINKYFLNLITTSVESLKNKKKPDKSGVVTSCLIC